MLNILMLILACSSNGCILRPRGLIAVDLLLLNLSYFGIKTIINRVLRIGC